MKRLIIHGDPGIRKGAVVKYDDEEVRCFSISRNGEWHGPDRVQLWCVVGNDDEKEDFELQNYIPHHLEVDRVDAEAVEVIQAKASPSA
ncbi:HAH_0734 family protein [Haloarchaeobius sp. DFWS5]|uniref:HAH_0734 family protein n=1 Tax=Haloarchaeobius sp. DFWS5 TaxID=3446114 RepID=UPI003EB97F2F